MEGSDTAQPENASKPPRRLGGSTAESRIKGMRQIVLDTETTGLETADGHRIIEIGCVEVVDRRPTRNNFHQYLQPDRQIDLGAVEVHGITNELLRDKPRFADIADDFLRYIQGAELIIHNAPFDIGFLDYELGLCGRASVRIAAVCRVTDTLVMARALHPGQRNTLDALCKRYGVDNSQRDLHGALLDAEILADVYLAMTGGQVSLTLVAHRDQARAPLQGGIRKLSAERPLLRVVHATEGELAAHQSRLSAIDKTSAGGCIWLQSSSGG
jgi:DNA polymerase-3 subunit epsilon